jgi:hypothetical protein
MGSWLTHQPCPGRCVRWPPPGATGSGQGDGLVMRPQDAQRNRALPTPAAAGGSHGGNCRSGRCDAQSRPSRRRPAGITSRCSSRSRSWSRPRVTVGVIHPDPGVTGRQHLARSGGSLLSLGSRRRLVLVSVLRCRATPTVAMSLNCSPAAYRRTTSAFVGPEPGAPRGRRWTPDRIR